MRPVSVRAGLPLGGPLRQEGVVPSLRSGREGTRSVEEPLRLLRRHAGLARSAGGGRAVRDPQAAKRGGDGGGGGGREEEGEEAQADDQRPTAGGEE